MRVLVVEDEPDLAQALRRGLESEGYTIEVSPHGDDVVGLAAERSYAAIVLDLVLPGRHGLRLCRRLRAGDDWTPVLVLTTGDGEPGEAEALDCGADDYLREPVSPTILAARLRALVRRGAKDCRAVLRVADLELDTTSWRCRRRGRRIELTARERAVLEVLMRAAGRVVSKTDILRSVWDSHVRVDPNVVETYVARLRRKVDDPYDHSLIQTVRREGYRIAGARDLPHHEAHPVR